MKTIGTFLMVGSLAGSFLLGAVAAQAAASNPMLSQEHDGAHAPALQLAAAHKAGSGMILQSRRNATGQVQVRRPAARSAPRTVQPTKAVPNDDSPTLQWLFRAATAA
jgi:hypothetical protein